MTPAQAVTTDQDSGANLAKDTNRGEGTETKYMRPQLGMTLR